jgi:hypothetical protein
MDTGTLCVLWHHGASNTARALDTPAATTMSARGVSCAAMCNVLVVRRLSWVLAVRVALCILCCDASCITSTQHSLVTL